MSHWQTFGGEQMIVLLMLAAFLMFSPSARRSALWLGLAAAALLATALLLGYTRGVWLGTVAGALYLIWRWKRLLLLAVPVALALVLWLNPERCGPASSPASSRTNNGLESVSGGLLANGMEMIKAHPVFGLGPEIVHMKFMEYVPADIPRPLPEGWYGHLHNVFIHYAAERGIPTALALMAALLWMLRDFARALGRLKPGPGDERSCSTARWRWSSPS